MHGEGRTLEKITYDQRPRLIGGHFESWTRKLLVGADISYPPGVGQGQKKKRLPLQGKNLGKKKTFTLTITS